MSGFEEEFDDVVRVKHHSNFNKERCCKKNKLGGGKYGPHIYKDERCINCGKVDPQLKKGVHSYE